MFGDCVRPRCGEPDSADGAAGDAGSASGWAGGGAFAGCCGSLPAAGPPSGSSPRGETSGSESRSGPILVLYITGSRPPNMAAISTLGDRPGRHLLSP
jgi:hypothetical protein